MHIYRSLELRHCDEEGMTTRQVRLILALAVWACVGTAAVALAQVQVPAHPPGTICFTPTFWCWAEPPAAPGTPCVCRTNRGPVAGSRG
jgi:hypothetical protein